MMSIICKKIVFIFITLISTASSFTARTDLNIVPSQKLSFVALQARVDSSDAVTKALEASKKFGAASKEARLAWETVEEMDSSDNSAAYSGGVIDEECLSADGDFSNDEKCRDYDQKMIALAALLEENKAKFYEMKSLAEEIQGLKVGLMKPISTTQPEEVKEFIAKAKEASNKFGEDSSEAKLAWETVEEVSASDNTAATLPSLEEECLVETAEACAALEEIGRVITLKKFEGSGLNS